MFREWWSFIDELIFPCTCHVCGEKTLHGLHLCAACVDAMPRPEPPLCFQCGEPIPGGYADESHCPNCHGEKLSFDFARAVWLNQDQARDVLLAFKYHRGVHLVRSLGSAMAEMKARYRELAAMENPLLIPVPMHGRKMRLRSYNQAEELSQVVSRMWGDPICHALERRADRETQTHLSRSQRKRHVKGLYQVCRRVEKTGVLKGRNMILIDDVLTTGSTADACAKALKKAGAETVAVLTLLRSTRRQTP